MWEKESVVFVGVWELSSVDLAYTGSDDALADPQLELPLQKCCLVPGRRHLAGCCLRYEQVFQATSIKY